MAITYDPAKRERTREERGRDFADAEAVFAGPCFSFDDTRRHYGEPRIVTIGYLNRRMVYVVWTPRDGTRHIISMRKTNDRETPRYAPLCR